MRRLMDWQDLAVGLAKQNRQRDCENGQAGWTMNEKPSVRIQLDYLQGPIWISDAATGEPMTGNEAVDRDPVLRELNHWAAQLFASYYAFEAQGAPCWFDHEKGKADKEIMLDLIGRIVLRLQEINDGSLTIEDLETERLGSL